MISHSRPIEIMFPGLLRPRATSRRNKSTWFTAPDQPKGINCIIKTHISASDSGSPTHPQAIISSTGLKQFSSLQLDLPAGVCGRGAGKQPQQLCGLVLHFFQPIASSPLSASNRLLGPHFVHTDACQRTGSGAPGGLRISSARFSRQES